MSVPTLILYCFAFFCKCCELSKLTQRFLTSQGQGHEPFQLILRVRNLSHESNIFNLSNLHAFRNLTNKFKSLEYANYTPSGHSYRIFAVRYQFLTIRWISDVSNFISRLSLQHFLIQLIK